MQLGYHLSCEEHPPRFLVESARKGEEAGFELLTISDHFHPWTRAQGQSPFVWAVIGAIAQVIERGTVGTAVTCPTVRMHPAICAHAAATAATMLEGRFFYGVGTGERLNECVLGDAWPPATVRRDMLEEAIEITRALWTGEVMRAHRGEHYLVEHARLFTLPEQPPPIIVSGFGRQAAALAGRVGDGYMHVAPVKDLVEEFREHGGAGKPVYGKLDVVIADDERAARRIAFETWPNSAVQGEVAQELAVPEHFEQAVATVREEDVAESILCSQDPDAHIEALREFAQAGFTHVSVQQCGEDQERFLAFYAEHVLPRAGELSS